MNQLRRDRSRALEMLRAECIGIAAVIQEERDQKDQLLILESRRQSLELGAKILMKAAGVKEFQIETTVGLLTMNESGKSVVSIIPDGYECITYDPSGFMKDLSENLEE